MATYSAWEGDPDFPPIPWDTLIRWGAMLLVWALAILTGWCLRRPVYWVLGW